MIRHIPSSVADMQNEKRCPFLFVDDMMRRWVDLSGYALLSHGSFGTLLAHLKGHYDSNGLFATKFVYLGDVRMTDTR